MSEDIKHLHKFKIQNEYFEIMIKRTKGFWETELLKGVSGTGNMCGGSYANIDEYIEEIEHQHKYSYSFFGYPKSTN